MQGIDSKWMVMLRCPPIQLGGSCDTGLLGSSSDCKFLLDQLADHVAVLADRLAVSRHRDHVIGGNRVAVGSLSCIKKDLDVVNLFLDGHWFVCVVGIPAR